MARGVFITGTDTDVGKTVAAVAVLRGLVCAGVRAVGMKPVSAGYAPGVKENDDVIALAAAGNVDAPRAERNRYAFAEPVAPHLAAQRSGARIELDAILEAYQRLAARADAVVVEGAGGTLVPIDDRFDVLDIARKLELPVLLVVGIRLGCLNHARLSTLAIRARGLRLVGWVASRIDATMPLADDNVAWLARELPVPCIVELRAASPPPLTRAALAMLGLVETR